MNWIEASDEDAELSSAIAATMEWENPLPWSGEDTTTLMPPMIPDKLKYDDVVELLSHAIVGCRKTLALKHFKVVLPHESGTNQKLSPPPYEYPEGIYIIVSPLMYRRDGDKTRAKDRDMTWVDYYELLPAHLKSHVWQGLPDGECTWSLSGPQYSRKSKPTLQQRYCYAHGRNEYTTTTGAALWTAYDQNHQEIYTYRVLHVYFSTKRASVKKNPSHVETPACTVESPTHDTDLAMAKLDAKMNRFDEPVLEFDMGSPSSANDDVLFNMVDGYFPLNDGDDHSFQSPEDRTPRPDHGFCDAGAGAASSSDVEHLDSFEIFDRYAIDVLDQYAERQFLPPPKVVAIHRPAAPPRDFHVPWDSRLSSSPVLPMETMPMETDRVLPARVSLDSLSLSPGGAQVSARSVTWAPLPDMSEEPDNYRDE